MGFAPADCRFFLSLTVSPVVLDTEVLFCFRVRGSVFFRIVLLDVALVRCVWTLAKRGGSHSSEPWFYLRLGTCAGLTLLRVLRGGLGLDECLGMTVGRANVLVETAPRTVVREPRAAMRERNPHLGPRDSVRYVACCVSCAGS